MNGAGLHKREEEIKTASLWLAGLMEPRLLLCSLIVCKIKMELFSQISDISGDLIPQQLFGIQQGSSAFFSGLSFPSAWSSALPAGRSSLFPGSTCQMDSHWPKDPRTIEVEGKKGWMQRHTKRFDLSVSKGSYCQIFAAPPQPLQLLAFPPLLPPLRSTRRNLGFGNESPSQHLSSWDSFLFGNSARNHTYATENPTKSIYFEPRKRELKDKHFAGVKTEPFSDY